MLDENKIKGAELNKLKKTILENKKKTKKFPLIKKLDSLHLVYKKFSL